MIFEGTKKSIFFGLGLTRAGVSMPTVDNLYALSKMLQVPMDSIVCGNAGRTKSQMDACLTDQERRVYTYYKKMRELNAA